MIPRKTLIPIEKDVKHLLTMEEAMAYGLGQMVELV
jgi:hypothetical protein